MTSVSRVVRWIVNVMWKKDPDRKITYAGYEVSLYIRTSTELCYWLWLIFLKWVKYIVEFVRICPIRFNWYQWHNSKDKRLSYFHTVEQVYQLKLHWPYFQPEPQPNNLVSHLYVTIPQFQRLYVGQCGTDFNLSIPSTIEPTTVAHITRPTHIRQNWPGFVLQKPVCPTLTPHFECSISYLQYRS